MAWCIALAPNENPKVMAWCILGRRADPKCGVVGFTKASPISRPKRRNRTQIRISGFGVLVSDSTPGFRFLPKPVSDSNELRIPCFGFEAEFRIPSFGFLPKPTTDSNSCGFLVSDSTRSFGFLQFRVSDSRALIRSFGFDPKLRIPSLLPKGGKGIRN